jgi:hypothetical protein
MNDVIERLAEAMWVALYPQGVRWQDLDDYRKWPYRVQAPAALSALRTGDTLPDGLVVMPVEPTEAMLDSAEERMSSCRRWGRTIYAADVYAEMRDAAKGE